MENRSRNTIASKAAILKNSDSKIPKQTYSTNTITGRAAILGNSESKMPDPGNNRERQRDVNLKVSLPPDNPPVKKNTVVESSRSVSDFKDTNTISSERLQEAIIWSEILGEPLSKRKRRHQRVSH